MAVERMEMMNVIGYLSELERVSMEIVRNGSVHIVNALSEINQNDFTVITPDQSVNALIDLCFIKPYAKSQDYPDISDKLIELMSIFGIDRGIRRKHIELDFKYSEIVEKIECIYKEIKDYKFKLDNNNDELKKIIEFQEDMKHIRDFNIDLGILKRLNYFDFRIVKFSTENFSKLNDNIENIPSLIYKIGAIPGGQVVISLTPKVLGIEVDRIFKSLNYEEVNIPYGMDGIPEEIIKKLDEKISEKNKEIQTLKDEISKLKGKYAYFIDESFSRMRMYEKIQVVNSETACTNEFFYMAGWIPVSAKKNLQKKLSNFGDRLLIIFKPQSEVSSSLTPPTKLKNNWVVRPFEAIVNMYGIPSYNELDPTSFVAISYLIMFGCMFGDVGQGFVFFLAGLYLNYKSHRPNFGGLLSRLGISSMIFGVLFGSIFGSEEVIKPLLIKPMDNIDIVLSSAIIIGIVFTTVGFVLGLVNAVKRRDLEDGVFGKDGLVGFIFYWIILLTAYSVYKKVETPVPMQVITIILCILLGLMVLKQPISNMLKGHRPLYEESPQDYYIESGFGVFETLLSMVSNTVSFIRVGAFALNHVGLFVAFATLAHLMSTSAGSIIMLVIGNIIVICLEGLVVFIQGLRLEYYEIFSKFYEGSGFEYKPVELRYTKMVPNVVMVTNAKIREVSTVNV